MATLEEIRERWSKWGRSSVGIRSPGHLADEHGYSRAVWFIDDNHADCINNASKDVKFLTGQIARLEKERDEAVATLEALRKSIRAMTKFTIEGMECEVLTPEENRRIDAFPVTKGDDR